MSKTYILNENIMKLKLYHNQFQHADYDDDLIGMFVIFSEWLKEIYQQSKKLSIDFPKIETPETWHKLNPHFPSKEIRSNVRSTMSSIFKVNEEVKDEQVLTFSHSVIFATAFCYQICPYKLEELMYAGETVTREGAIKILLEDGLPEGFIKEPSNNDYTNMYD